MAAGALALAAVLALAACSAPAGENGGMAGGADPAANTGGDTGAYHKITAEEAKALIDEGGVTVVDVRTPKEYADGLCTTGGLIVDTECRVLTKDRQPIPGLFAAGITSGGMFYNTYPHNLNCLSHTRNCLMGYTIGQVLGGKQ